MGLMEQGAAVLPPIKVNAIPPTGSIDEYTAEDANMVRRALLDLRDFARGTFDRLQPGGDIGGPLILAGSRTRVWYRDDEPANDPSDPHRVNDLWFDTSLYTQADVTAGTCATEDIGKVRYDAYRWDGDSWESVNRSKLIVAAEIAAGAIAAQHISAQGLDASVITSGLISAQFIDVEGIVIGAANVDATLQATIEAARADSTAALEALGNLASDSKVTRNERPALMREAREAFGEYALYMGMAARYDGTSHPVVTTDYEDAFAALDSHLKAAVGTDVAPGGLGFPTDYGTLEASATTWVQATTPDPIPIDGATLRRVFEVYYLERAILLDAMASSSNQIINLLGTEIQDAKDDLAIVLPALADIASDAKLTPGEKGRVMKEARECFFEYPALLAQAQLYDAKPNPVPTQTKNTYVQNFAALDVYLKAAVPTGLGMPSDYGTVKSSADAWVANQTTLAVDGPTMRAKFEAYFTARRDLVDAVWVAQRAYSDTKLQASDLTPLWTDINTAKANATSALDKLNVISSDSWLSKDEKPAAYIEWVTAYNEYPSIVANAANAGASCDAARSVYIDAYVALRDYLAALSPAYNDSSTDTAIDRSVWNMRWYNYYVYRSLLLTAIFDAKVGSGDVNRFVTSIAGGVITTGYVNADRLDANAFQTIGYDAQVVGKNTAGEYCTGSGTRIKGNRPEGGPGIITGPGGIRIGSKTLSETWLSQGTVAACFAQSSAGDSTVYFTASMGGAHGANSTCAGGTIAIPLGSGFASKNVTVILNGMINGDTFITCHSALATNAVGTLFVPVYNYVGQQYTTQLTSGYWSANIVMVVAGRSAFDA